MNNISTEKSKENTFQLKAYSLNELAQIYEVSTRTFSKWLQPFKQEIGERCGRYYTVKQVQVILDKIGIPQTMML